MNNTPQILISMILLPLAFLSENAAAGLDPASVDFSSPRAVGVKTYRFETKYESFSPAGEFQGEESTRMDCTIRVNDSGLQVLTCKEFLLTDRDGKVSRLPQLSGWTNTLELSAAEVLGVKHSDFSNLKDADGIPLPPNLAYRVYNTFIDLYAFNNLFAQPCASGSDQDISSLKEIGSRIIHVSAFLDAPTSLGDSVKEGSFFRNGEVSLEWKGMSESNGNVCALVGFDSGKSTFKMLMEPAPKMNIVINGGSRYWGDLYINTTDYWVEKATFFEVITSEMVIGEAPPVISIVHRIGTLMTIPQ